MKPKRKDSTPVKRVLRSSCHGECGSASDGRSHEHHHHRKKRSPPPSPPPSPRTNQSARKRPFAKISDSPKPAETESVNKRALKIPSFQTLPLARKSTLTEKVLGSLTSLSPVIIAHSMSDKWLQEKLAGKVVSVTSQKESFSSKVLTYSSPNTWKETSPSELITNHSASAFDLKKNSSFNQGFLAPLPVNREQDSVGFNASNNSSTKYSKKNVSKTHYSDYSSADELDSESDLDKTGYTYARSASYSIEANYPTNVPSPNMSRRSLHSSGNHSYNTSQYNTYQSAEERSRNMTFGHSVSQQYHVSVDNSHVNDAAASALAESAIWGASANTVYHSSSSTNNINRFSNRHQQHSSSLYGLDSESDDEIDMHNLAFIRKEHIQTKQSLLSMILNIGECVLPVQSVWQKIWAFVYWILSSLLLWDTWILSRGIFKKGWILLLLLLLPLILLGASHVNEQSSAILSTVSSYASSVSIWPMFAVLANTSKVEDVEVVTLPSSLPDSHNHIIATNTKLQKVELLLDSLQQAQLDRPDIEQIVRSVVKEEIFGLSSHMNVQQESVAAQAERILDHNDQLKSLDSQMKLILTQSEFLSNELRSTKEKIMGERQSDHEHSLNMLRTLELELEALRDSINHVQETQTLLLSNMRNCCRNHTFDPALVESQVAAILLQVMGKGPKPATSRTEFQSFAAWLKSSFVGQDDLDVKLSSATQRTTHELNPEVLSQVEKTAKSAAAAAVRASLLLQEQNRPGNFNLSATNAATLNEDEVRRIVHDALILYDADKTGQADFALESAGGSIISTRCSETYQSRTALFTLFGLPLWYHSNSPRTVIQPGVQPGECWAFKGSEGYLVIQLSGWIQPTAFSMEHIPRGLAPNNNVDSAPKEFSIYGLKSDKDMEGNLIGQYVFNIDGDSLQYFLVEDPDVEAYPIVELRIHSNHGNLDYTCLYRFRVHGKLTKPE